MVHCTYNTYITFLIFPLCYALPILSFRHTHKIHHPTFSLSTSKTPNLPFSPDVFQTKNTRVTTLMMSERRSRQSTSNTSRITDDQIIDLVSKLHRLLPEISSNRRSNKTSPNKVLQETCNYIRTLHKEVDDLSERLSQLLSTINAESAEAAIIRSLI